MYEKLPQIPKFAEIRIFVDCLKCWYDEKQNM